MTFNQLPLGAFFQFVDDDVIFEKLTETEAAPLGGSAREFDADLEVLIFIG